MWPPWINQSGALIPWSLQVAVKTCEISPKISPHLKSKAVRTTLLKLIKHSITTFGQKYVQEIQPSIPGKYSRFQWIYSLNSLNTSTMHPIVHVPHYPCGPSRSSRCWHYSLNLFTEHMILHMTTCLMCTPSRSHRKDVKLSKNVKFSKIKHLDYGGGSQKINWWNEVQTYWHQFWCHL